MGYRWLVTAILLLHGGYLAYVVLGGFLAWRWPRTRWLHLAAAAWGIAVVVGQLTCPLTYAEDWARRRAGDGGLTRGFIDRYVEGVLYPERFAGLMQALAAAAVAISWLGLVVRHRRAAGHGSDDTRSAAGRRYDDARSAARRGADDTRSASAAAPAPTAAAAPPPRPGGAATGPGPVRPG